MHDSSKCNMSAPFLSHALLYQHAGKPRHKFLVRAGNTDTTAPFLITPVDFQRAGMTRRHVGALPITHVVIFNVLASHDIKSWSVQAILTRRRLFLSHPLTFNELACPVALSAPFLSHTLFLLPTCWQATTLFLVSAGYTDTTAPFPITHVVTFNVLACPAASVMCNPISI